MARQTFYAESLGQSNTTSATYQDKVTLNATLDPNSEYLGIFSAAVNQSTNQTEDANVRLRDDTAGSDLVSLNIEQPDATDLRNVFGMTHISTGASPSATDYKVQYAAEVAGATVNIEKACVLLMKLGTNDKIAESNGDSVTSSTTYQNKTTLTFTPATAGNYLILAFAEINCLNNTSGRWIDVKLSHSGSDYGLNRYAVKDTANWYPWGTMVQLNLTNTSHSFTIDYRTATSNQVHIRNAKIFAIRLDDLNGSAYAESRARSTTTSTSYQDKTTLTNSPTAAEHVILACGLLDGSTQTNSSYCQLTQGGTSKSEMLTEPNGAMFTNTNEIPFLTMYRASLAATSTTWKTQYKSENASHTAGFAESAIALLQTGDGSVTYQDGAASLSGSGSVTAAGQSVTSGSATLAGTGSISATGQSSPGGTSTTLAGVGTLAATGSAIRSRTATLAGTGSISATGIAVDPNAFPYFPHLISRYEADNPDMVTVTIDVTFASTAVDTVNNRLLIADQGFLDTADPEVFATPVFLDLSGGSITSTPQLTHGQLLYWRREINGYVLYTEPDDDDYVNQPGAMAFEVKLSGQNYAQNANRVDFASATGNIRIYSNPLAAVINDMGNGQTNYGYNLYSGDVDNKHTWAEIGTTANGKKFFYGRLNSRDNDVTSYAGKYQETVQGKGYAQGPAGKKHEARQKLFGKRAVGLTYVADFNLARTRRYPKTLITKANIATGTNNVIAFTAHPFKTGNLIKGIESTGNNAAPVVTGTSYYARSHNLNSFSIYTTLADANADTNRITLSADDNTKFLLYAPARVGDAQHWNVLSLVYGPDGGPAFNANAPRLQLFGPVSQGKLAMTTSTWGVSGANNGVLFLSSNGENFKDGQKVYAWLPEAAVAPTRADTLQPLEEDNYWMTRQPGSTVRERLHQSELDAQVSVGIPANLLATTGLNGVVSGDGTPQCIKYINSVFSGEILFEYDDGKATFATNLRTALTVANFDTRLAIGSLNVITFLADYNHPDYSCPIMKIFVNGQLVEIHEYTGTDKSNLPADDGSAMSAWIFMNDNEPHGPFNGIIPYNDIWAAGDEGIDDSEYTEGLHPVLMRKYLLSATLAGQGNITATAQVVKKRTATLTGTGAVTAFGSLNDQPFSMISGVGTLSGTGLRIAQKTISLTGTGAIAATASRRLNSQAARYTVFNRLINRVINKA